MTRDEARAVLCAAADRWASEIVEYVIPDGQHDHDEIVELVEQVNEINEALVLLGGDAYAAVDG